MVRFNSEDIMAIKQIISTPYSTLLNRIRDDDYDQKKSCIEMIDTFKKIHKDKPTDKTRDIITDLLKQLDEVNGRIQRLEGSIE